MGYRGAPLAVDHEYPKDPPAADPTYPLPTNPTHTLTNPTSHTYTLPTHTYPPSTPHTLPHHNILVRLYFELFYNHLYIH